MMKHPAGAGEVEVAARSKKSDWSKTLRKEMEMGISWNLTIKQWDFSHF
jgi:hypothetical protein